MSRKIGDGIRERRYPMSKVTPPTVGLEESLGRWGAARAH